MKARGPFPFPAVLLFLGIVVAVRLASRNLPAFVPLQPDLIAAALFLYAPLLHYRSGNAPTWIRFGDARKCAVAGVVLAVAGTLAYMVFTRLSLPPSLAPHWDRNPPVAAYLVTQALLVALPEEVFFRGYLYDAFEETGREPILPSSILFAAGHLVIHSSWYRALTFFPGILFGGARRFTGNVYVPIVLHLLFNLLPLIAGGPR